MNVREEGETCRQVEGKLGLLPTNAKKINKKKAAGHSQKTHK